MNTRTGKIARLPQPIREQLNRKLEDGVAGPELLEWLNGLWKVREILQIQFGGESINAQNLTAWRQGGFVDWQRHQQSRETARELVAELDEIEAETGVASLSDRLGQMLVLMMGRLVREAMNGEGPERHKAVLEIARELSRLRHGDHRQRQAAIAQERHEMAIAEAHRVEREYGESRRGFVQSEIGKNEATLRAEYEQGLEKGTLAESRRQELETLFTRLDQHFGRPPRPTAPAETASRVRPRDVPPRADQGDSSQFKVIQATVRHETHESATSDTDRGEDGEQPQMEVNQAPVRGEAGEPLSEGAPSPEDETPSPAPPPEAPASMAESAAAQDQTEAPPPFETASVPDPLAEFTDPTFDPWNPQSW